MSKRQSKRKSPLRLMDEPGPGAHETSAAQRKILRDIQLANAWRRHECIHSAECAKSAAAAADSAAAAQVACDWCGGRCTRSPSNLAVKTCDWPAHQSHAHLVTCKCGCHVSVVPPAAGRVAADTCGYCGASCGAVVEPVTSIAQVANEAASAAPTPVADEATAAVAAAPAAAAAPGADDLTQMLDELIEMVDNSTTTRGQVGLELSNTITMLRARVCHLANEARQMRKRLKSQDSRIEMLDNLFERSLASKGVLQQRLIDAGLNHNTA